MFTNRLIRTSRMTPVRSLLILSMLAISATAVAKTELTMAHQLEGQHAVELETLVNAFNAESKEVMIHLVKRSPTGKPAVLNLATRSDLARYLGKPDAYVPVEKLLADNKVKFNPKTIAEPLRNSVTVKGQVQALPVAFTTPLLFWNKELFKESGLDPNKPPKTWEELQDVSGKLKARCSYTTSWPVWVHIDNVSAWAGSPTVSSDGKLAFNTLIQVRHLARLTSWYKTEYFTSFGFNNEADAHFVNGECGMITTNAEIVSELQASRKFDFGVAPLPVIDDNAGAPFNTLASGGAIWVGQGHSKDEYKAANAAHDRASGRFPATDAGGSGRCAEQAAARRSQSPGSGAGQRDETGRRWRQCRLDFIQPEAASDRERRDGCCFYGQKVGQERAG
jgi:sn-glycerol 3-phosphate transport system substrate-binding protein